MHLTKAVLYYVCAALWLLRTLNSPNVFDAVLTVILFVWGIMHTVKYIRQKKSKE